MSTPTEDSPTTMECRVCRTEVPAGEFCGLCGDHLVERRGNGPSWLRPRAYGAAPGEHLLLPSLASSLFPHLPHRSRTAFRIVLGLVLLGLVTFATLRMPASTMSEDTGRLRAIIPVANCGASRVMVAAAVKVNAPSAPSMKPS
ncbi:MAG TPA: hypothetical protein VHT50_15580, partial [Mycobacterium sp.]|nr:hypothetical protein [Mycobacterium sp.]